MNQVCCIKCHKVFKYDRINIHVDSETCKIGQRNLVFKEYYRQDDNLFVCNCGYKNTSVGAMKNHINTKHIYLDNGWEHKGCCSKEHKLLEQTDEYKKEHSKRMKQAVLNHPESYSSSNVSGRVKTYIRKYNGHEYKLKGSWELLVADKLFSEGIYFDNKIQPVEYIWSEDGKKHLYFPDFYIIELDLYIEVKGYQRQRDLDKWKAVDNLIVIKEKEINMLKRDEIMISELIRILKDSSTK